MVNLGGLVWQIISAVVIAIWGGLLAIWIDRPSKRTKRICILGLCVVSILTVFLLPGGVEPPIVLGKVMEGDGMPVLGAAVLMDGKSAATDTRGKYIIIDAPAGRRKIEAWRGQEHIDGFINVPKRGTLEYDFVFP